MLSLIDAHDAVLDLVPVDLDPALTPSEVDAALSRTQLAAIWTPSTAYSVGQKVVPVAPMGRVFICAFPGTSDTTEPSWLIAPRYVAGISPLAGWFGGFTFDPVSTSPSLFGLKDGTVAWGDYSPFAGEIYNVGGAVRECWILKAMKAANRYDVSVPGGPNAKRSQLYEHCMRMAGRFAGVRIV